MEKAAIYVRLSKEDDQKDKDSASKSIENQKNILLQYAKSHEYEVYNYYCDDDYSGLYMERPGFTKMLEDASRHCFSTILAKSQSRLSRNMEHTEYLLHDLFPSMNIRFIGVTDGVDTFQKSGKKARQINALVNEWYSEDLSESIRAVYRRKMQMGEYLGAYAPYGYRKSRDNTHRLVIVEEEAKWIRKIYQWYLEGKRTVEIQMLLNQYMVPTPSVRLGRTSNARWSTSTIKKILSNETYTGAVVQGKSERKSFKDKTLYHKPKEAWTIVENCHEAIIDREIYAQVCALRTKRCRRKRCLL